MISRILIGASAAIFLYLGSMHLTYTFFTHKFSPRESQLETAMKEVAPRISSETTMWKAWIGFHISHSMGALLFGLTYAYLVVCQWELLQRSYFLTVIGLLMLIGYVVVARIFWFKRPLIGALAAMLLYVAGFVYAFTRH